MTSSTNHSDIDQVRDATDLVRLIGEHVRLEPRGREHVGLCPFHDDHKPSFAVVTHKGNAFYKCFACGASGDCFRFLIDHNKWEFPEALRYLADRAGITLTPFRSQPGGMQDSGESGPRRSDLRKAMSFAQEFFAQALREPVAGAAARDILAQRGISDESVTQFALGLAPQGYSGFLDRLQNRSSSIRTAHAAGLLRERPGGNGYYDTFRNRIIFPICDDAGQPIAFGGRIIDPEDNPKYLNSPETALFHKSRTLYGLHLARRSITRERIAIVTEGYTDVIACHQAGISNVVGTLGTALTREHAAMLSRLCDSVVLVFDGDEAGQRAADRGVEVFFSSPVDVRICVLPDGLDPDDLLRQEDGADRFRRAVESSIDALAYKLQRFTTDLESAPSLSGRQKRLEAFLQELADLGFNAMQGTRKAMVLTQLADLLKLSIAEIERAMPRAASRRSTSSIDRDERTNESQSRGGSATLSMMDDRVMGVSRARRMAERDVLAILLFDPPAGHSPTSGAVAAVEVFPAAAFADPTSRVIAEVVMPLLADGHTFTMQSILSRLADPETARVASGLYFEGERLCESGEKDAASALHSASEILRACMEREAYGAESAGGAVTDPSLQMSNQGDVLERIRRRQQHGYLPAAIPQGVRS